jgi:pimeloyl-ACP methyl ester carboxylesterase
VLLTDCRTLLSVSPLVRRPNDWGDLLGLAVGGFKNTAARQHYLTVYAEVRALGPRPDVVHDVETEFGTVRVYQHGPSAGEPVVLVHGFFLTSAMWWEQVAGLTSDFTVYVMDMLGQPGASTQTKKMSTPADSAGDPPAGSPVDALSSLFVAGFVSFAPPVNTPPRRFASNRLLQSVDLPVQVLLAGNTVHDSAKAIRRLAAVVPTWRHHLLANASHALFAEHPGEVNDCIRHFAVTHRRGAS